jgi:hypothetical protein
VTRIERYFPSCQQLSSRIITQAISSQVHPTEVTEVSSEEISARKVLIHNVVEEISFPLEIATDLIKPVVTLLEGCDCSYGTEE